MGALTGFEAWPKIPRLKRNVVVTEKIDGTNACVVIGEQLDFARDAVGNQSYHSPSRAAYMFCQSRNRIITPDDDNAGFARWAWDNAETLIDGLGVGRHFGEWWGKGIQRGYGMDEKRFSLFNTKRWGGVLGHNDLDGCHLEPQYQMLDFVGVRVVPVLGTGPMSSELIDNRLEHLREHGSYAAPGFMRPEGVVVFHVQAQAMFKVLLDNDELPKSAVSA